MIHGFLTGSTFGSNHRKGKPKAEWIGLPGLRKQRSETVTSAGHVTFKRGSLDRERIPEVYTENQS